MRDKRPVDELSIEELERVLAIRKREERQQRLERMRKNGRVVDVQPTSAANAPIRKSPPPSPVANTPPNDHTGQLVAATVTMGDDAILKRQSAEPRFEEESEFAITDGPRETEKQREGSRKFMNRLLLLVEVAAVLALIVMGVNMLLAVNSLAAETAAAQEMANQQRIAGIPTPEPTAIIQVRVEDFVLPGGHTIDENGNAFVNLDEFIDDVPSHLQMAVQEQILVPVNFRRPEPTSETALFISIPKLGIDQSIVQGTDWEALKRGVGQVLNGATPSDASSNMVLAAHNDVYGELFRHLDQLEAGDEFYIQTRSKTYTYRITGWDIVNPKDIYVMESQGRPTATLISCYPYGVNNKRYVVFADRVDNAGL